MLTLKIHFPYLAFADTIPLPVGKARFYDIYVGGNMQKYAIWAIAVIAIILLAIIAFNSFSLDESKTASADNETVQMNDDGEIRPGSMEAFEVQRKYRAEVDRCGDFKIGSQSDMYNKDFEGIGACKELAAKRYKIQYPNLSFY